MRTLGQRRSRPRNPDDPWPVESDGAGWLVPFYLECWERELGAGKEEGPPGRAFVDLER